MDRRYALQLLACLFLTGGLLNTPLANAGEEKPANLNAKDKGIDLPVSLVKGRVASQNTRYILGPGDKITIKIQDLDQFNQSVVIRPDGYATVHPFGEHRLSGTDLQGLQALLEEEFKLYLLKPTISVDIIEMRPAIIYTSGAIRKPGTYQFSRANTATPSRPGTVQENLEITLTNVLGKTGGLSLNADIGNIQVIHAATGEKETFNLRDFLSNKGVSRDIQLMPEDRIIVPEAAQPMDSADFKLISNSTYFRGKFPVIVLGAVQRQGEVRIDPANNSLNAAIAQAGGFVPRLSKRNTVIMQRPNKGTFKRWVVLRNKTNLELMPGDIVYVPESGMAWLKRGFSVLDNASRAPYVVPAGTGPVHQSLSP